MDGAALAKIAAGIAEEAGEGWEEHPLVLRGRNAVRAEHGLSRLGESPAPVQSRERRPWYRRLF